ncbi:sensor histidine kinase [Ancylobacter amanitiformis]|uniref:Blue-light-activated histidine kinase n=1 Tax=Ancylobacter amanitiformis TaxID=217069 RepID=A0ABU0LTA9_9HYPH|nr:HWE histidine kinase domain-containing protein [Ancylobacter amanitiformis]MDQ0511941.1 PAS domain S-box-containing protein [Ancylobacter amanitiformis]
MPSFQMSFIDDAARWITIISCLAIAGGVLLLINKRPELSGRMKFLGYMLSVLLLTLALLSMLALSDSANMQWQQSLVRVGLAVVNAVGAVALLTNLRALVNLPLPAQVASEQRRLTLELATVLQRYEMALRGSNVAIFTQDRDLRYTSVSKPLFGFPVEQVLNATDAELLGDTRSGPIHLLKREALMTSELRKGETEVEEYGTKRWYDLHIEPLRDLSGATIGLTGAAVDVTERKENEQHLRLLMRELTHRSKNLLAVIQAMARQTARHAGSIDEFVEIFSARLQALARSHDLLVQEGWHGASLNDMVRSQLGHHFDHERSQVTVSGPDIFLKPEAAQNIGLALHELSTNAAKYGALSVPGGQVAIRWARRVPEAGGGFELSWIEKGGPPVTPPRARGFGSLVIERNLARALDGKVDLEFDPAGLHCSVEVPEQHLTPGR